MRLRVALLGLTTSSLIILCSIPDSPAREIHSSKRPFYLDGNELQRRMELVNGEIGTPLSATDSIDGRDAMSYVMGIADAIQGISACPMGIERTAGIFPEVTKYMYSHPEQLSWSAAIIVKNALSSAYPCGPPLKVAREPN